ncbi:NADP-dependent oxidoreductase, partial [Streptomyces sp. CSDS2]|nr:NADP-dependent oxidoreductase [Streptomyces sp. CSDS2]
DVAGVVDAVGPGTGWKVGERVFAVVTGHHKPLGTHADHIVVDAGILAPSPVSLDDVHAATLPLNATTASQALDLLDLAPGQSLLVVGAHGGVGAHAVELAHQRGLKVTGAADAAFEDFVRARGADHFLARGETFEPASFDGVLDTASLGTAALAAVRDGGAYAGLWPGSEPAAERGIRV